MDSSAEQKKMIKEKLLDTTQNEKGGLKTIPFILVNEAFEKVASYGIMPNMILYLMNEYHMSLSMGTNTLYMWSASSNFTPVLGAFLADSFFGRFLAIGFGSIASLLGMIILCLTATIPQARPPPCIQSSESCKPPAIFQLAFFYLSLAFMAIGAGGIRSCSMAFGADQLQTRDDVGTRSLETYFSWYNIAATAATVVSNSVTVYIQEHYGWQLGFGVLGIIMLLSVVSFYLASPFYVKLKPKKSLLTGFAQVIVASYKNRHIKLPSQDATAMYHHKPSSDLLVPSNKLRYLNKACIIRNPLQDLTPDKSALDPWSLTTVDQVEELKALIKVIPIWSTGLLMLVSGVQNPINVLQANSMDRHVTPNFEIPAGSFGTFSVITIMVWLALYDRVLLPLMSKLVRRQIRLGVKLRMGIGIVLCGMYFVVSGIIEYVRRNIAIEEGFADNPEAVVNMSALWLIIPQIIAGIALAFNAVAQMEFYYSEFPKSMSSIGYALFVLGMALENLLTSFIFNTVDNATKGDGRESWVSRNINKGHYDYYQWLVACLVSMGFVYFIFCCRAYGPCVGDKELVIKDEEEGIRE